MDRLVADRRVQPDLSERGLDIDERLGAPEEEISVGLEKPVDSASDLFNYIMGYKESEGSQFLMKPLKRLSLSAALQAARTALAALSVSM